MLPSFLSFTSLYGGYLRRCFTSAGLSSHSIPIDDETTIHFWGPKTDSTQKPSLLLLHGFGPMALWQWRQQVQFFAPKFNIYVPDLVFFGGSTTKSTERSEKFQAASMGKLLERIGVKKVHVIGTSYGGFVAYHLRRLMSLFVSRSLHNMVPDFLLTDFLNKLYSDNRKEKMELLKGISLGRDDTLNISPLQQEVLIIWGENDRIFPVQMATELKQVVMSKKKARLEVIKDASHVPQIEKPREFNNIILHFLN